jgi:RHS repeat-associated protein
MHYFTYDANGNVGQLVAASDGTLAAHYEYDPYGNTISAVGPTGSSNTFRFSSKYYDDETSLSYYGYRYYSPGSGRWLRRDPINEAGGANLYSFLENDATNYIDPFGEQSSDPVVEATNRALLDFLSGIPSSYSFGPDHPWTQRLRHHPHMTDVRSDIRTLLVSYCRKESDIINGSHDFNLNTLSLSETAAWIGLDALSWISEGRYGQDRAFIFGSFRLLWHACYIECASCIFRKADVDFEATDVVHLQSMLRIPLTRIGPPDEPFGRGRFLNNVPLNWYWSEQITR